MLTKTVMAKTVMPKPVRVAYLVSHPIQYQAPLLRYLTERGNMELTVFFMSDFSLKSYSDPGFGVPVAWDTPLLEGYRSETLPALGGRGGVTSLRPFNTGLARRLTKNRFDALWMHGYAHLTGLRAMALARMRGIPILLRAESQADSALRSPRSRGFKEAALRQIFRRASAFLAIGSRNREYYESNGVPPRRIFPMPYAVDNAFFQARAAEARGGRAELRAALGLTPGRPIILYAAKFIARKRAGDLLEAYRMLSPDGWREPEPYLIFIGEGEEKAAVEARAKATHWSSIRFLGFRNQTELPAYFDLCDVFVLPSEKEPWGLIVNEVMNAGRPVIVSDGVGAADDLIRNGFNGFVYPVGDVRALAGRLRQITAEPGLQQRMGARNKEIISRWSFHEDCAGLERALEYVIGQGQREERVLAPPDAPAPYRLSKGAPS